MKVSQLRITIAVTEIYGMIRLNSALRPVLDTAPARGFFLRAIQESGFRIQEQESGFRIQDSGFRSRSLYSYSLLR